MVWLRLLPWRFALSKLARRHGFLDPIALMARLRGFTQPSEVAEPIELLRAGVVLHARGLINSRIIQHNLDWVWPYWVERQFDPGDPAFIPRAFSITHINLTHRNWTAVGLPDCSALPIVDPRGLVTPHFDGWSLDGWIVPDIGEAMLPSRASKSQQRLGLADNPSVRTESNEAGLSLATDVCVELDDGRPVCRIDYEGRADRTAAIVVSLRPCNPEGVSFVHEIGLSADRGAWSIDGRPSVRFSDPVERHHISDYRAGDVHIHLTDREDQDTGKCDLGMATAAAMFRLSPGQSRRVTVKVPLDSDGTADRRPLSGWQSSLNGHCRATLPDRHFQFLYDAAIRMLVLHAWDDVVPGPYTYKRFWFRDAAFLIHALLAAGLTERAERAIDRFPSRQTRAGYFHSQDGEWDSNGEALWIMHRFCALTGRPPKAEWRVPVAKAARWIVRKRLPDDDERHAGLLPAGFSAEHLGPNDYYYWDDFWGVAGLRAAAALSDLAGDAAARTEFRREADSFAEAIDTSLAGDSQRLGRPAMPASPYRRLDAGAVGSLAAGYPLQLVSGDDPRLLDTVEHLMAANFVDGGFFQEMTHSGINAYLTLHIAQILLRAGDTRYFDLMKTVARLASPTGQWPEAIHPATGGGCMGDGQHIWAAAEWILMIRNCFVREEEDRLILGSGVPPRWLEGEAELCFGPAPTAFGSLTVSIRPRGDTVAIDWQSSWHREPPTVEIRLPGWPPVTAAPGAESVELKRVAAS